MMDVNGDGHPDMVYSYHRRNYDGTHYYNKKTYLNNGGGTWTDVSGAWVAPYDLFYFNAGVSPWQFTRYDRLILDFNGDGIADLEGYFTSAGKPDLLKKGTTGLGGSVSMAYQLWGSQGDGVPMPVTVVSSVTTDDGLGTTSVTGYAYSGGYWKPRSGRKPAEFRGFRTVTVTNPDGSKGVTYYHQGNVYKGLVEKSYVKAANDNIYAASVNEYDYQETNNGNTVRTIESQALGGVYLTRLRATNSYSVEGATSNESLPDPNQYKMARSLFNYDA